MKEFSKYVALLMPGVMSDVPVGGAIGVGFNGTNTNQPCKDGYQGQYVTGTELPTHEKLLSPIPK